MIRNETATVPAACSGRAGSCIAFGGALTPGGENAQQGARKALEAGESRAPLCGSRERGTGLLSARRCLHTGGTPCAISFLFFFFLVVCSLPLSNLSADSCCGCRECADRRRFSTCASAATPGKCTREMTRVSVFAPSVLSSPSQRTFVSSVSFFSRLPFSQAQSRRCRMVTCLSGFRSAKRWERELYRPFSVFSFFFFCSWINLLLHPLSSGFYSGGSAVRFKLAGL